MIIRAGLLFLCIPIVQTIEKTSCPHSLSTARHNVKCPTNERELGERAKLYNCEQHEQNCTSAANYKYHCVLNAKGDGTIELCAPVVDIIGGLCTEFTTGGLFLQEHAEKNCNSCPFKYISSNVFNYKECYQFQTNEEADTKSSLFSTHSAIRSTRYFTTSSYEAINSSKSGEETLKKDKDFDVPKEKWWYILIITIGVIVFVSIVVIILAFGYNFKEKICPKNTYNESEVHETEKTPMNNANQHMKTSTYEKNEKRWTRKKLVEFCQQNWNCFICEKRKDKNLQTSDSIIVGENKLLNVV
ncbi:uncharacterized protein LOC133200444 [Saccostrea echinata]|uniref:uncharacterized protein LOC133200444 n=1 Tax=Saccostrea echinata TaxID=191078 RepID=UPI002A82EE95|nr:uncharacterized protein LOC133200444 [Saccostrea echinata]